MIQIQKLLVTMSLLLPILLWAQQKKETYPPEGFVYIHKAIPHVEYEIRYAGEHNFTGEKITGYLKPVALLSQEAADALKKVQETVKKQGYHLKIFDAYRPQQAVNHFIAWAKDPEATCMKDEFYPEVDKADLFRLDYIASRSGHTRGSTIDLTLVETTTGKELDMGSLYDFFGKISHHGTKTLTNEQKANRAILKNAMRIHGFRALATEWWHYSLQDEPYPDTYFDFPVK